MCNSQRKQFSTSEIAAAMEVGETSVKRWIDAGKLAAEKTPGGHRRVELSDFYNFLRASGRKLVAPEAIGISVGTGNDLKSHIELCQKSLQNGDAFTFESVLHVLRLSEPSPAAILDKTVYPAFQALRATCSHPSEECMVLHRAIAIAQAALRATMLPGDGMVSDDSPRVVLADIGYEVDGIPALFAEASVWDKTRCLQLGINAPAKVVEGALDGFNADVLWLSASGPSRRSAVNADFQSILLKASQAKVKVVVFGDAVPKTLARAATHVSSFGEFRGFVSALV